MRVNNSGGHFQLFTTGWANTTPIPDACLILEWRHNSSCKMRFTSTDRSGSGVMTYRSSRKANNLSPSRDLWATASKAACYPRLNSMGISGSPSSPPSLCVTRWACPRSSSHKNTEWSSQKRRTKGKMRSPPSIRNNPSIMALCHTRSKAPTPSMDRIVALVCVWRTWATHSHPARVRRACWKGAVAFSVASAHWVLQLSSRPIA